MKCTIAALDLDGTLLNDKKNISEDDLAALRELAESGAQIVPATGRIVPGLRLVLDSLPFVRWAICSNGAGVYDLQTGENVHRAEIPVDTALRVCEYMDGINAIYDCYMDGWGYMTRSMYERSDEFYADNPGIMQLVKKFRTPVDELKAYIKETNRPLQKLQLHFIDMDERRRQLIALPELFPDLAVTSSLPNNIEINHISATKGRALSALCGHLGLDIAHAAAFGDGGNDLDMLKAAGLGVAMANATDSVKASADFVTRSNNESGVAYAVRTLGLSSGGQSA